MSIKSITKFLKSFVPSWAWSKSQEKKIEQLAKTEKPNGITVSFILNKNGLFPVIFINDEGSPEEVLARVLFDLSETELGEALIEYIEKSIKNDSPDTITYVQSLGILSKLMADENESPAVSPLDVF